MEELGSIRYLSHMDFSVFCKKFKKAAVRAEECNSWTLAGRNASGMWVPPIHCAANIVGFTSGPEEVRHLCGCKSCSELVLESWWVILKTYS